MRLGDHLGFRSGTATPQRAVAGRYPVYGANGVIGYAAEPNVRGPVIVVGRVGTYCGSVRYCDSDLWVTDNAFACRARNPRETRYWYYALQTVRLNEYRSGSGQPLLNQRTLQSLSVPLIGAEERPRIVELLGALDDKIAANAQVIELAEALMVAAVETVSARVPLSELATRSTVVVEPAGFPDTVAHFSLPAFDDGASAQVVDAGGIRSSKYLMSQPCVLFAKLNPRIPRIWNVPRLPAEMAVASTEFVVLTPTGVDTSVLWAAVRQPEVSDIVRQQVGGTSGSHQRIQPRDLLGVPVPDVRLLGPEAARTITSLGALCQARRTETARLAALRDWLLPLLVSGAVRVDGLA